MEKGRGSVSRRRERERSDDGTHDERDIVIGSEEERDGESLGS